MNSNSFVELPPPFSNRRPSFSFHKAAEQDYEKEKLNERIAKLSGGVAVIQVGAQTGTELEEKKLRVEDALNATKAAVEEGIVVGGGCTLLRLASKVDAIKATLANDEEKVGADIVKRALSYPLKLIAKNAGVNGNVVSEKVLSNDDTRYGYNAATGKYKDLMSAGIIDPTKRNGNKFREHHGYVRGMGLGPTPSQINGSSCRPSGSTSSSTADAKIAKMQSEIDVLTKEVAEVNELKAKVAEFDAMKEQFALIMANMQYHGSNIGSPFEVRRSSESSHNVESDQATPDD
ncbi:TCP-1/cpn60 chaperonin family protein [Trifolium repens]|nr:TCP-1/cpn60 chaperonin family protein [Trifolium repens]